MCPQHIICAYLDNVILIYYFWSELERLLHNPEIYSRMNQSIRCSTRLKKNCFLWIPVETWIKMSTDWYDGQGDTKGFHFTDVNVKGNKKHLKAVRTDGSARSESSCQVKEETWEALCIF